jgi:hypothetical protein
LLEIADPAAIPALENHLGTQEPLSLVKVLSGMSAYQASLALAGLAVLSESADVRSASIEALRDRRKEDFVPPLIQMLKTPATGRALVSANPVAKSIVWQCLITQETQSQIHIWKSTRGSVPLTLAISTSRQTMTLFGGDAQPNDRYTLAAPPELGDFLQVARSAGDELYAAQVAVDSSNDLTEELNRRVSTALSGVSGERNGTDPQEWWSWWDAYSGLQGTSKVIVEESEREVVHPVNVVQASCFQAGTLVWTESGVRPIEQIEIGDRVLAQNVETGELAYKPVLQTTVRDPRPLVKLNVGGESVTCTDGHRFWVAGEAWVKARDLKPQHLLHTARGTVSVESVTKADVDRTYNLVVADFHSYFVGKQAFLVQDLPLPPSTNCVVPGLQPEWK